MKKKKIKRMINKLKKKSERELDVEVNLLTDKINSLETSKRILEEKIRLIDDRTMALDTVKVQKALDMMKEQLQKAKELDSKIKILMDRTSTDYSKMSSYEISYQECISLIYCMKDRGATKEEINGVKKLMNKYIFRCKLLLVDDEVPTPEEIIDCKKEA